MDHLPHRNYKNSIWMQSELHLNNWLSPEKTKNPIITEKIKISKILLQCLQVSHRYISVPNFIQKGPNCEHQAGDKLHQTDRQTHDRQTDKIFIAFSQSQRSKTRRKKVSARSERKNFGDCSNICPSGLRTYNKKKLMSK